MSAQRFRQGQRVPRNVYDGDEPLFVAVTAEKAAEYVVLLNAEARATRAEARVARGVEIEDRALFLVERLAEFEREMEDDEVFRQYAGHVAPAAARLRSIVTDGLGKLPPTENAAVAEHLGEVEASPKPQVNPMLPEGA